MSDKSKIEWTDATWNPVRGCTKVSPGCVHCYAETFAERFRGVPGHPFEFGFDLRLVPEKLGDPLRWRAPRMVFVNSMSDLFHDGVPDQYVTAVAKVMAAADWHTFQVLTKRAERLASLLEGDLSFAAQCRNIWWGVSVENRKHGLVRIEHLRRAPAAVRFLSIEPLLEDLGRLDLRGIDWVIVGGESGPGARPMSVDWVRGIRDQCRGAGVPFFFKQWGGVVRKRETGETARRADLQPVSPAFKSCAARRQRAGDGATRVDARERVVGMRWRRTTPTVGREQTLVKHFILRKYLSRFAPIVLSHWNSISYVDCFSGPWNACTDDLRDTSFSIALEELRRARDHHADSRRQVGLRCFFLERNADAYARLKAYADAVDDAEVETRNAILEESVDAILDLVRREGRQTFPFIFIDPTGWTGFAMDTIAPLLSVEPGEVLINLMTKDVRRFIESPEQQTQASFDRLFRAARCEGAGGWIAGPG